MVTMSIFSDTGPPKGTDEGLTHGPTIYEANWGEMLS